MKTRRLDEILYEYANHIKTLNFLSVDVEGFDLNVLKSNDWNRFKFDYLLIETLDWNLMDSEKSETVRFIEEMGYHLFARTVNTSIFKSVGSKGES